MFLMEKHEGFMVSFYRINPFVLGPVCLIWVLFRLFLDIFVYFMKSNIKIQTNSFFSTLICLKEGSDDYNLMEIWLSLKEKDILLL